MSSHNVACRRRMEALIKADDPDRWARWLLRRGQEEEAAAGHAPPLGDAGAPSGSADPAAVSKVSEEAKLRKSGHHEEASESDSVLEAPEEARKRKPGCRRARSGGDLIEMLCKVDMCEVFSPPRVGPEAAKFGLDAGDAMDLTTGWDFTKVEDRRRAEEYVD